MEEKVLSIREISNGLKDRKLHMVGAAIGLSFPTLQKLAKGKSSNFNFNTLSKVSKYLTANRN